MTRRSTPTDVRSAKRAKGQRRQYLERTSAYKQIADKYLHFSHHYWQKSQVTPPTIISAPNR